MYISFLNVHFAFKCTFHSKWILTIWIKSQSITRSNNAWHRSLYKINFINDQFRLDEWHALSMIYSSVSKIILSKTWNFNNNNLLKF